VPLTDEIIAQTKPKSRATKLSDRGALYLLLKPNGARYWRFKYRFAGKEKLAALGVYPAVSIAQARERRDGARAFLRQGIDPVLAHREASREHIKEAALGSLLRIQHANDGRVTIETPSITVRLTKPETDALRAFLLANP
jgi:Arm domain-containing DNA-binding protein